MFGRLDAFDRAAHVARMAVVQDKIDARMFRIEGPVHIFRLKFPVRGIEFLHLHDRQEHAFLIPQGQPTACFQRAGKIFR